MIGNNDRLFLVFITIKIPCEILPHVIRIAHLKNHLKFYFMILTLIYNSRYTTLWVALQEDWNFKLYLTFTLHYSFHNFYLLLLPVGSRVSGTQARDLHKNGHKS